MPLVGCLMPIAIGLGRWDTGNSNFQYVPEKPSANCPRRMVTRLGMGQRRSGKQGRASISNYRVLPPLLCQPHHRLPPPPPLPLSLMGVLLLLP